MRLVRVGGLFVRSKGHVVFEVGLKVAAEIVDGLEFKGVVVNVACVRVVVIVGVNVSIIYAETAVEEDLVLGAVMNGGVGEA